MVEESKCEATVWCARMPPVKISCFTSSTSVGAQHVHGSLMAHFSSSGRLPSISSSPTTSHNSVFGYINYGVVCLCYLLLTYLSFCLTILFALQCSYNLQSFNLSSCLFLLLYLLLATTTDNVIFSGPTDWFALVPEKWARIKEA